MSKEKLQEIKDAYVLSKPFLDCDTWDDFLRYYYISNENVDNLMKLAYNQALEDAANNAKIKLHDGYFKKDSLVKHIQMGANNATIDKQLILKLKI